MSSDVGPSIGGGDGFSRNPGERTRTRRDQPENAGAFPRRVPSLPIWPWRLTHHYDIVETGNESWRFKSRDDDHATRARLASAIPASSDETSATSKPRRTKGSKLDADEGSNLNAD